MGKGRKKEVGLRKEGMGRARGARVEKRYGMVVLR